MKTRSYLLLLILLTVSYFPAFAGEYAYVLRFNPEEPECIVQFNTDKDEIVRTIEIPAKKAFNNMIVDENGGCYISDYYYFSDYGRDIYYYDTRENQIKRFMDTGSAFGPHYMALTKDYLIVQAEGRDETRGHGGVIFIDRKKKEIVGQVFLKEDEPYFRIVNVLNMFQGDDKYVFLTTDYLIDQDVAKIGTFECFDNGDIYVIDINKKELFKTIEIPRDYRFIFGGCNMGDKIYIAAATKGLRTYETDWPSNRELLVFSLEGGKLIKKIPISPHSFYVTGDKSVSKLYVLHRDDKEPRNTIEIIDTLSDKVIGSLEVESQLMFSIVAPGKMYITKGPSFMHETTTDPPKLLVLDTKTDKIIKEFDGNYQGISVNPRY